MSDESKIIQIIPSEGWFALFEYKDPPRKSRVRVAAWALTKDGYVVGLDGGNFMLPFFDKDLVGYEHERHEDETTE